MTNFLKKTEYEAYVPESVGKVRVNHESGDCSGSSNSMIVERKKDGRISAYCYRCGKFGGFSEGFVPTVEAKTDVSDAGSGHDDSSKSYFDLARATGNWEEWPLEIRQWVGKFSITRREVEDNGLMVSSMALYIPIRTSVGIVGWQRRNFSEEGPKYATHIVLDSPKYFTPANVLDSPRLTITEDAISAIKCSRYTSAIALLGVHASSEVLKYITDNYKEFVIFFDDDNVEVKRKQRVLKNTLELYGATTLITGVGCDPKECTDSQLKELLL